MSTMIDDNGGLGNPSESNISEESRHIADINPASSQEVSESGHDSSDIDGNSSSYMPESHDVAGSPEHEGSVGLESQNLSKKSTDLKWTNEPERELDGIEVVEHDSPGNPYEHENLLESRHPSAAASESLSSDSSAGHPILASSQESPEPQQESSSTNSDASGELSDIHDADVGLHQETSEGHEHQNLSKKSTASISPRGPEGRSNDFELVKLDEVIIDKDIYPRVKKDDDTMRRYVDAIKMGQWDRFPPITLEEDENILLDGYHRYMALRTYNANYSDFKQSYEDACKSVEDSDDPDSILPPSSPPPPPFALVKVRFERVPEGVPKILFAHSFNARHGKISSTRDMCMVAKASYKKTPGIPVTTISKFLGVDPKVVAKFIEDEVKAFRKQRDSLVSSLFFVERKSPQEISDALVKKFPQCKGSSRQSVLRIIERLTEAGSKTKVTETVSPLPGESSPKGGSALLASPSTESHSSAEPENTEGRSLSLPTRTTPHQTQPRRPTEPNLIHPAIAGRFLTARPHLRANHRIRHRPQLNPIPNRKRLPSQHPRFPRSLTVPQTKQRSLIQFLLTHQLTAPPHLE